MCIILHKSPNACETRQSTTGFVPVYNTKLCHANRELLVAAISRAEDEAVAGTVHGFERPFLLLDVQREHAVLVILPVARCLPQLRVVHVWGDDFLVATLEIFSLHQD